LTPPDKEEPEDLDPADPLERRSQQFAQGAPPVPRKAIIVAVVAFVVLGLGGALFDHFFGGPVNTAATVTTGTDPPSLETPTTATSGSRTSQLPASIPELLGLATLSGGTAPSFTLTAPGGQAVSLDGLRGKVVVLSFFDSECNDICPVLATELREALDDLGTDAPRVVVLTVNTDPVATSLGSASPAERASGLGSVSQWRFLTGTLQELDAVWKAYGVSIEVEPTTNQVSHNNLLYFIDQKGKLRLRATPFANESHGGSYSLSAGTEQRFAAGISSSVRSLLGSA
jgi:cytochrome oxidase Cu insertion factor (SCO1/SenC/PrrC family)